MPENKISQCITSISHSYITSDHNMAPPSKRRKKSSAVEEVTFDFDARSEYLTGFHKRKVQRIKQAQEQAAKQDRLDKLENRKRVGIEGRIWHVCGSC